MLKSGNFEHDVSEMYENLPPQHCIRCDLQAGNLRWEESAPLEQDWTHPSYPFDSWTPQAMLSFCAEPQGGVAESMIKPWTLAVQERGGPSQKVGEGLESVCFTAPHPSWRAPSPQGRRFFSALPSIGFCNFGQGCPSCRMTFWKRWEQFRGRL